MTRLLALLLLVCALMPSGAARAHESLPLVVSVRQTAPDVYVTHITLPPFLASMPRPSLTMPEGCAPLGGSAEGAQKSSHAYRCTAGLGGQPLGIRYQTKAIPAVPILVRLDLMSGEVRSLLAEPGETRVVLPTPETPGRVLWQYAGLGVTHILEGYDHLLFLICLLLIARTPRRILLTVTGFTVGHAVTITAVTLGVRGLASTPVEVAIALSIVVLAAEVLKPARDTLTWRHPVLVSTLFGLLHGLGFAGALREIGLPQTEVPLALVAFNLGIEAGQLVFVAACLALAWGAGRLVARASLPRQRMAALGAGLVAYPTGGIAAYWFLERLAGA